MGFGALGFGVWGFGALGFSGLGFWGLGFSGFPVFGFWCFRVFGWSWSWGWSWVGVGVKFSVKVKFTFGFEFGVSEFKFAVPQGGGEGFILGTFCGVVRGVFMGSSGVFRVFLWNFREGLHVPPRGFLVCSRLVKCSEGLEGSEFVMFFLGL